jgi:helicase required for RNAi-mediated heterochromatin assembly 1
VACSCGCGSNTDCERFEYESTAHFSEAWRKIPETPTPEELLAEDPDVPTNVIDGPFPSVDDYLSTHYELVREDVLSGLRGAVRHVRNHPNTDDTREIAVYENVCIMVLVFNRVLTVYRSRYSG